jgi:hypothetical protein
MGIASLTQAASDDSQRGYGKSYRRYRSIEDLVILLGESRTLFYRYLWLKPFPDLGRSCLILHKRDWLATLWQAQNKLKQQYNVLVVV